MLRRLFFTLLVLWALIDAFLTAEDMPTIGLAVYGFFSSFLLSLLFVGAIYLVWDWIGRFKAFRS